LRRSSRYLLVRWTSSVQSTGGCSLARPVGVQNIRGRTMDKTQARSGRPLPRRRPEDRQAHCADRRRTGPIPTNRTSAGRGGELRGEPQSAPDRQLRLRHHSCSSAVARLDPVRTCRSQASQGPEKTSTATTQGEPLTAFFLGAPFKGEASRPAKAQGADISGSLKTMAEAVFTRKSVGHGHADGHGRGVRRPWTARSRRVYTLDQARQKFTTMSTLKPRLAPALRENAATSTKAISLWQLVGRKGQPKDVRRRPHKAEGTWPLRNNKQSRAGLQESIWVRRIPPCSAGLEEAAIARSRTKVGREGGPAEAQ